MKNRYIFILIICIISSVFYAADVKACNHVVKVRWCDGNSAEAIRTTIENAKENTIIRFEKNKTYIVNWSDCHHLAILKAGMTIDGNGATIKIADGTNTRDFTWGSIFRISRKANITIKNINVDFNGDHNPVLQKLEHLYWERNGLTVAEFADGLTISNCKLIGQRGANDITIFSSNNIKVQGCTFINSGQVRPTEYLADHSSLLVLSCKNAFICGNKIVNDTLRSIGTGYDLGLVDSKVRGNFVSNAHYGMILSANNTCKNVIVRNNEFRDNTYAVVTWSYGKTETYPEGSIVENILFQRNKFQWEARNGQYFCRGINMKLYTEGTTKDIRIIGNTFVSNIDENTINFEKSFEYAIYLGAASKAVNTDLARVENVTITGNSFNTILGPAIRLTDKAYHTRIKKNTFKDCSCTRFAGFDGGVIVASVESRTTLSDIKVEDNRFINDRYHHGKYGIALYNSLSEVSIFGNTIRLATDRQMYIEPRIQKEHMERKDIVVK